MGSFVPALEVYRKLKKSLHISDALDIISFLSGTPYSDTLSKIPSLTVEEARLDEVLEKLLRKVPVAYITGRKEFFGLEFAVSSDTLIPRPETEKLVEWVKERETPSRILDLCTGTGNILITLLTLFSKASGVGADISRGALKAARENARNLGVEERSLFEEEDILSWEGRKWREIGEEFDLITVNPPYLSAEDYESAESSLKYEPKRALTDGGDGLSFYRKLFKSAKGTAIPIYFEIGAYSLQGVLSYAEEGGFKVEVWKDIGGIERVVRAVGGS